jgi:DNA repair exonuclease SbcCD ATPase subunit
MIVHSLLARNALKYERVELSDLPERGVILVTGPNESGKSTIGELLCLGLYGRTFAVPTSRIDHVVRWGARSMELEMEVTAPDGHLWRIRRNLDLDGAPGASLYYPSTGTDIAGWDAVTAHIVELLGFGFESFVESFYLARRDIGPPTPRAETLKAMAGVLPLERTADELLAEVPDAERKSEELGSKASAVKTQLAAIARDDLLPPRPGLGDVELVEEVAGRIAQLEDARARIEERLPLLRGATERLVDLLDGAPLPRWERRVEGLDQALDGVEEAMSWLGYGDVTSGTEKLSGFLDKVQEGVKAFADVLAKAKLRRDWVASMLGQPGAEPILGALSEDEDELQERSQATRGRMRIHDGLAMASLVIAAGMLLLGFLPIEGLAEEVRLAGRGFGVLAALAAAGFAWSRHDLAGKLSAMRLEEGELAHRRAQLEADSVLLASVDERSMPEAIEKLRGLSGGALQKDLDDFEAGPGGRLTRVGLKEKLEEAVETRMGEVENHLGNLVMRIAGDTEELSQIHDLRARAAELAEQRRQVIEHLATLELAAELSRGAAKQMTHAFNNEVRQGMVRVLPSLTEGRYQYLQIEDGTLAVRVFSSEKQDFVAFEEISGGTQRQIELATRFALSEAVVRGAGGGPQFLFLDEPFAFFDAQRTRASMAALPRLSSELPQVWIAAQTPPEGGHPALHFELTLDAAELVDGGEA